MKNQKLYDKMFSSYGIKKRYCGFLDFGDLDSNLQFCSCNTLKEWREACSCSNDGSEWVGDAENCKEVFQKPLRKYPFFSNAKIIKLLEFLVIKHNMYIYKGGDGEEIELNMFCGALFLAGKTLKEALAEILIEISCTLPEEDIKIIKNILEDKELEEESDEYN